MINSLPRRERVRRGLLLSITLVLLFGGIGSASMWHVRAALQVNGYASSSVLPCLPVGTSYLGADHSPSPYWIEQSVRLDWTGDATSAQLVAYEFNANDGWGHDIYINGHKIGTATGSRNSQTLCRGFEGQEPLSWDIDPSFLVQGENTIRITVEQTLADQSWGLSRLQIKVFGNTVHGPQYEQMTVPSSYYFNWQGYENEGTWTHVRIPSTYNPASPTPLLILAHGFGSNGLEAMLDFVDAAEAKGWLLASADYHGEVNNGFYDLDDAGNPLIQVGRHSMGSRASQYDVIDVVNYMQANYTVDAARVYLVGHSMGGMTALLTAAKWPQLFAAVVSDSSPTELTEWEYDTRTGIPPDSPGLTPNININLAIQSETGAFTADTHELRVNRRPYLYDFEYDRRSPQEFALNFKHLPLLIQHPIDDTKVHPHHAEDLYLRVAENDPDHVELNWFPGDHNQPIVDRAAEIVDWLDGYQRQPDAAPQHNSFTLDESGRVFWVGVQLSSDAVAVEPTNFALRTEAHFTTIRDATYDRASREINLDAQNLEPDTGDWANFGAYPPEDLTVDLVFYLDQIGMPGSGPYTVERINKDNGEFSLTYATASGDALRVPLPRGAFLYRIAAGDQPPSYQTLHLQRGLDGYQGAADTTLSAWATTTNYGVSDLHIHHDGDYPTIKAVLRFDLSPLPPNARVRFALLSIYLSSGPDNENTMRTEAFQMNQAWEEHTATWNQPADGATWAQAGAEGVPGDRSEQASDYRLLYAQAVGSRYGFDVTDMVRGWQADEGSNDGLMLRAAPQTSQTTRRNDSFWLASSENYLVARRPKLSIVYTVDDPTPTPTATPTNTPTFTPTATPTNTPTATLTPTATPTPPRGSIVAHVFYDENRNGARDGGEIGRAGVMVWLKQNGAIQRNLATDQNGLADFEDVPPGDWTVEADMPPGYEVTTAGGNPINVIVTAGNEVITVFGLVLIPTATPTPTATATNTATATPTLTPTATPPLLPRQLLPLLLKTG